MTQGINFEYDDGEFTQFGVTVNVVLLTIQGASLCVLLSKRKSKPFQGVWALPGGNVRPKEDLANAALRVLSNETGHTESQSHLEQLAAYGNPTRDPRMRVVSVAYWAISPEPPNLIGGRDSTAAKIVPLSEIVTGSTLLAFDHPIIVKDALARVRRKLENTALAAKFCPPAFTISQLRRVYEIFWGEPLDAGNFQRFVRMSGAFRQIEGDDSEILAVRRSISQRGRPPSLWTSPRLEARESVMDNPKFLRPRRQVREPRNS